MAPLVEARWSVPRRGAVAAPDHEVRALAGAERVHPVTQAPAMHNLRSHCARSRD